MPFNKGKAKTGGIKKGQRHKKTVLKENLGIETIKNVDQFEPTLIKNWIEFLTDEDKNIKLTATKECSKFVFPTKRQVESTIKEKRIEDIVKECNPSIYMFEESKVRGN